MSTKSATLEQLRDKPDDELASALADNRDELFRLHLGQHTNQVTSTALLQTKRRDIARIMTILRGRKLGYEAQAQKAAVKAEAPAEATDKKKTRKTKTKAS